METERQYWLLKSEPESYGIDHLRRDKIEAWTGVRNFQARNHMMKMEKGDLCLFYHSSTKEKGVAGVAKVARVAHPDATQFDKKSHYYEPRATKEKPMWFCVDVAFVEKFKHVVTLGEMKLDPKLQGMLVRSKFSRLSVQPVSEKHFNYIRTKLAK